MPSKSVVIRHHHPEPSEQGRRALAAAKAEVMRAAQTTITTRHDPESRARLDALARKGSALARAAQTPEAI